MEIYKNRFQDIETLPADKQKKFKANELFVLDGNHTVRLLDLFVLEKRNADGTNKTRKVRSVADFKNNLKKSNNIFIDEEATFAGQINDTAATIMIEKFSVPDIYDSVLFNKSGSKAKEKIPFGLKRTLEVEKANTGEGEYLYVFVGEKSMFMPKDQIFWYDGLNKKTYIDAANEGVNLSTIQFVDEFDHDISAIYTEYEYKFSRVLAREKVNLSALKEDVDNIPAFTMQTYTRDEDGNAVFTQRAVDKYISEQIFITEELEISKDKKKKISKIKAKNYFASPNGEFVALVVNGQVRMTKISNLVDRNGNEIKNLESLVGEAVRIKEGDETIATSEPLRYEQANLRYDTIKTYQESSKLPDETTCLRLSNGSYVKELENVQPISFKLADDESKNFDKYLIEQIDGGVTKYVVIDKDYYSKRRALAGFNINKAKKLVRCDFNDKKCAVVQTTSKQEAVEQCSLIKKIKFGEEVVEQSEQSKMDIYQGFKTAYQQGEYNVEDVYINGEKVDLGQGKKRYEYSDVSYHEDYAENLRDYKTMKTKNLSIKDGKIVGGAKFSIADGIADSYSVWGKALLAGVTIVPLAGIFVPILVPAVAVYSVGVLAAAPLIPVVNAGIGLVKNNTMRKVVKYKDKTEHDRSKHASAIRSNLNSLLTRKDLNQTQFEDAYLKVMNEISMFAKTTSNSSLVVVNGNAEVNHNNANLVKQFIADYNEAKVNFEIFQKRIEALNKAGKSIPKELQEAYDIRKAKFEALKNTTRGQSYEHDNRLEILQDEAATIRLYVYIKNYPDSELALGLSDELKSKLKYSNIFGLTIDGISINASEKKIARRLKKDEIEIAKWKALRKEALVAIEQAKEVKAEKPIDGEVENKLNAMQKLDEVVNGCELTYALIEEVTQAYVEDYVLMNNSQLISQAIMEDIQLLSGIETKATVEDVERVIQEIISKHDTLKEYVTIVETAKTKINEVEEKVQEFNNIAEKINSICLSLNGDDKDSNCEGLQVYEENITKAYTQIKKQEFIEDLTYQANIIFENKTQAEELLDQIVNKNKESIKIETLNRLQELYQRSEGLIKSLNRSEVKNRLSSVVTILNNNKRLIKELTNDVSNDIKEKESQTFKASFIVQLIEIGVDALKVLDNAIANLSVEVQSKISEAIGELTNDLIIEKDMSIKEIREYVTRANVIYETKILPYLATVQEKGQEDAGLNKKEQKDEQKTKGKKFVEKNTNKVTTRKNLSNNIIVSENAVIRELEDENSATYQYVFNLITKSSKRFKLTKDEAMKVIFNLTVKANAAHDKRMYAKDVVGKDTIEEYILNKAKLQMSKAIQLQL